MHSFMHDCTYKCPTEPAAIGKEFNSGSGLGNDIGGEGKLSRRWWHEHSGRYEDGSCKPYRCSEASNGCCRNYRWRSSSWNSFVGRVRWPSRNSSIQHGKIEGLLCYGLAHRNFAGFFLGHHVSEKSRNSAW